MRWLGQIHSQLPQLPEELELESSISSLAFSISFLLRGFFPLDSFKYKQKTFTKSQIQKLQDNNHSLHPSLPSHLIFPLETIPDGNCFFRALSYHLFHHQHNHIILRLWGVLELLDAFAWYRTVFKQENEQHLQMLYEHLIVPNKPISPSVALIFSHALSCTIIVYSNSQYHLIKGGDVIAGTYAPWRLNPAPYLPIALNW
jgi:hypothetical protein